MTRSRRLPGRRIPVDPELEARARSVEQARRRAAMTADMRRAKNAILARYARRMTPGGKRLMRCIPTQDERAGLVESRTTPGNTDKLIFDTRDQANACALEMTALTGVAMRPYHCPRHRPGRDGHWHLTTDGKAARRRKNRQLQQLREAS